MYDMVDRPVDQLATRDRAWLDATRRWTHALALAGAVPSGESDAFGAVMRALDQGSRETLVIQRPCHSHVGETEAVLLGIWQLVAADRIAAARAALGGLLDPAHADLAVAAMLRHLALG